MGTTYGPKERLASKKKIRDEECKSREWKTEITETKRRGGGESHHKSLEIRPPPLSQTITYLPFVLYAMGGVELAGIERRSEAGV